MHLRSRDVKKTAEYYQQMFDAEIVESIQSDGRPRTDLDLNGLTIFIAPVAPDAAVPPAPTEPYVGLDHFGLRVDDMDEAVAELKRRGASFMMEPRTIRPGVKIAFVQAPDDVRIELLERRVS
jgi:catechol 2,3-dioxygenase-like lactoylglutathione lyase family enzyme